MKKYLLIIAVLLVSAPAAFACKCAMPTMVRPAYKNAEIVMIVFIAGARDSSPGGLDRNAISGIDTIIEKVYKGDVKSGEKIFFTQGQGADCRQYYKREHIGQRMLVFTRRPIATFPIWQTRICSRTVPGGIRADDLLYLEKIESVAGKTRLSGLAYSGNAQLNSRTDTFGTWKAIAGLRIRITGNGKTYKAVTDENGVYEIYGLPPGRYTLRPDAPKDKGLYLKNASFAADFDPDKTYSEEEKKEAREIHKTLSAAAQKESATGDYEAHIFPGGHASVSFHFEPRTVDVSAIPKGIFESASQSLSGLPEEN